MQAFYGFYAHDENSVEVTTQQRNEYNERGGVHSVTKGISVTGQLRATTQAGMTAKIKALENAYKSHNLRWVLKDDNGDNTPHDLTPGNAKFGVRVVQPPSFTQGAEVYALSRTFSIQLEATYEAENSPEVVAWQESITVKGTGGPSVVGVELLNGLPEIQLPTTNTLVYVSQSGSSVGRSNYLNLFGPGGYGTLNGRATTINRGTPQYTNGDFENYPESWSYEFIRDVGASLAPPNPPQD